MSDKTELHCHTAEVSDCATASAEWVVNKYIETGYDTLFITNHMSRHTFGIGKQQKYHGGENWNEKMDFYFEGFRLVTEIAKDKNLNILLGVELNSNTDGNDYLIYGLDEEFYRSFPDILDAPLKDVIGKVHKAGGLFFQPHPFRNSIKIKKPAMLDGIEAFNGHIGHDSRNDIANMWADKYGLMKLSGSDMHHEKHTPNGGILTDMPITSEKQLVEILKSGSYTPLHIGEDPVITQN